MGWSYSSFIAKYLQQYVHCSYYYCIYTNIYSMHMKIALVFCKNATKISYTWFIAISSFVH